MGVGAFGGFHVASSMATMNVGRSRGGYGGGYDSDDNDKKNDDKNTKFKWSRFILNSLLFLTALYFLLCAFGLPYMYYSRVGVLTNMNQSEHKVKSNSYPDYYFTVKWSDRQQEKETFEVDGTTYYSHKTNDDVYFKRLKEEYEWTKSGWLLVGQFVFGFGWLFALAETLTVRIYK